MTRIRSSKTRSRSHHVDERTMLIGYFNDASSSRDVMAPMACHNRMGTGLTGGGHDI